MTRYKPEHKARTRRRLVESARHTFRRHGFDGTSIDRLMNAAGLTRGGFYAHFRSKEDLVEEVLELEPGLLQGLREDPREAVSAYLDPARRGELIDCAYVAHAVDGLRDGGRRRGQYGARVRELVAALEDVLSSEGEGAERASAFARRRALVATVLTVGGAVLAAAVPDEALARELATVAKEEALRLLDE